VRGGGGEKKIGGKIAATFIPAYQGGVSTLNDYRVSYANNKLLMRPDNWNPIGLREGIIGVAGRRFLLIGAPPSLLGATMGLGLFASS